MQEFLDSFFVNKSNRRACRSVEMRTNGSDVANAISQDVRSNKSVPEVNRCVKDMAYSVAFSQHAYGDFTGSSVCSYSGVTKVAPRIGLGLADGRRICAQDGNQRIETC